ncbi:protein 60A-like [Tropilaelaps mercedesae]|uniref:Protein 60A-like n=1 Tax=Tropilaelaps mercedesae TaxID=418985 RepID=A0A1V9XRC1_9ACAR|nr:protein 60A-like [Tropilaelaps mercedesae]
MVNLVDTRECPNVSHEDDFLGLRGIPGVNAERSGYTRSVQFLVPEAAREELISARLRLRKVAPDCSVKLYKVEDGLRSLVADLQIVNGISLRNRRNRVRRVVDLTSSMKSWLRFDNVVELQLWESQSGCVRELPTFDIMATEISPPNRGRSKRSVRGRFAANSNAKSPGPFEKKLGSSDKLCKNGNDKVCCLRLLNVSVSDLGWEDWIVEPRTFQAYFCKGQCYFRHGRFATSHAALQSKMSVVLGPRVVPRPCCSPKKFRPLPVMYRDQQGNTHFGRIPKMIVKECACQ